MFVLGMYVVRPPVLADIIENAQTSVSCFKRLLLLFSATS
jgi:hypothetical protein